MLKIRTKITYVRPPDVLVREFRPIVADSLQDLAGFWHEEYLPLHFRSFAPGRYNYQRRTYPYRRRKRREQGHQRPLEWSGTMKRQLLRTVQTDASHRQARARLYASALSFSRRSRTGRYPDLKKEVTSVAPEEPRRFAGYVAERIEERIGRLHARRTVTVS